MSKKVKPVSIKGIFVSRIIRCSFGQKYNKKHLMYRFRHSKASDLNHSGLILLLFRLILTFCLKFSFVCKNENKVAARATAVLETSRFAQFSFPHLHISTLPYFYFPSPLISISSLPYFYFQLSLFLLIRPPLSNPLSFIFSLFPPPSL